jgi:1-acyl-sn-glycerol-3-phosphate acyltransferase
VARLALATGVRVIPVAQWGAQQIRPYGGTWPRVAPRMAVRMRAGTPVDLTAFEGKPLSRDVLRGATNAILADITCCSVACAVSSRPRPPTTRPPLAA